MPRRGEPAMWKQGAARQYESNVNEGGGEDCETRRVLQGGTAA